MATNASWLLKNRARDRNQDSEWSFSCRTTPYNTYSDSNSDAEDEKNGSRISEEALLLNELDLSTREETVQYKPNPFSIAKINAASRGLLTKENKCNRSPSRTLRSTGKPAAATIGKNKGKKVDRKIRPNASIVDGLKKQSQKATLASQKVAPVISLCSAVPPKSSISTKSSNSKSSSNPLVISHVEVPHVNTNSITLRDLQGASDVPVATHIPISDGPTCAMPLSSLPDSLQIAHITSSADDHVNKLMHIHSSVPSREDFTSNLLKDDSAITIKDDSTEFPADIEFDTFPGALPQQPDLGATLFDAKISVPSALTRSPNRSEGPPFSLQQGHDLDPSPPTSPGTLAIEATPNMNNPKYTIRNDPCTRSRPLLLSSPPQQRKSRTHTLSSFTASHRFGAAALSSPLRPVDPSTSNFCVMSKMPVTPLHVAPGTFLATPFSYQPLGRRTRNSHDPITSAPPHFTDDDHLEQFAASRMDRPPFSSSSPLREITPGKAIKPLQLDGIPLNGPEIVLTPHDSGDRIDDCAYNVTSEDTTSHPENTNVHLSQGLITPTESASVLPSNPDSVVYYPNITHKRLRSPPPEPRTTKVRLRPIKDAYDFLSSDPDENWSTLPARKKVKTQTPTSVIRTRKFRLPKLSLGNSRTTDPSQVGKTGMDATSARRVITFLPPPLKSASTHLLESKVAVSRAAYPSPSYSVLKSSSSPAHEMPHHSPAPDAGFKVYKPLSPPSSDSPCIKSDSPTYRAPIEIIRDREDRSDAYIPINLPSIARLYPDMKTAWRQRRRRIEEIWNLMNLPSCGRVYCDNTSDVVLDRKGFREIGIVVFRGT
ncbi:hypothetical protein H2248_011808 [Termitomyces sp. 'cryptogamus']|nr:hypothetical protein H2248_011808 [Termitomyces sp. 'cryptogamus']